MDRLDAMRIFARVMERRSFTLAAEDLGIPRSGVTDAVKQIEARLRTRLLHRTTRHVSPTLDGEAYYQRCVAILADVEDAESAFADANPQGLLRIDVHGTLARHFLLPKLQAFFQAYPDIEIYMAEGDRLIDVVKEGVDCVLRVGVPQDSDLIVRRIAMLDEVTLASSDYIEAFGMPTAPDQLTGHRVVGFRISGSTTNLPLELTVNGIVKKVVLPSIITVNAAESYISAALHGMGIIQVPKYHAQAEITSGRLVEVLKDFPPTPTPVSVLYPKNRQLSPRVRIFIDWVAKMIAWENDGAQIL